MPVDNPATHLELTMVHEAMILEYSGRHLAVIELAAMLKLALYVSLIICVFVALGPAIADASVADRIVGARGLCRQAARRRRRARRVRDQHRQDAGVPRARFRRAALMLGFLGACSCWCRGRSNEGPRLRRLAPARRRPRADELPAALSEPPLRAAQRLLAAGGRAVALGRLAGLRAGRERISTSRPSSPSPSRRSSSRWAFTG